MLAIAALAVLGAGHVDAAEAGEAADAETCSAKHVCMDSKLVALLRKHELEAAIAPLVADDPAAHALTRFFLLPSLSGYRSWRGRG